MSTEPVEINKDFLYNDHSMQTVSFLYDAMHQLDASHTEFLRASLHLVVSTLSSAILMGQISRSDLKGVLRFVAEEVFENIAPYIKPSSQ